MTNEAHLAHQYLKEKVADYLVELKTQNPTYFSDVQRKCKIASINKHRGYSLSFEFQELAEDLTGVVFEEEDDLRIYYEHLNTQNADTAIEFSLLLCNLIGLEIKNQLLHKEELLFDIVKMDKMQRCNLISILSNLKDKIT